MRKTWIILGKELRVMLRDRRLILGVVLVSLVVLPALMGFMGNLERFVGGDDEPVGVLVPEMDATLASMLADRSDVTVYRTEMSAQTADEPYLTLRREDATYRILTDTRQTRLLRKARELETALDTERERRFAASLTDRGLSATDLMPFEVELVDTAGVEGRAARILSSLVPYLVIILLVTNAIRAVYVAVGEKEKNTLASLLVSMAPRPSIVLGKSIAIMTFAIFASVLLLAGLFGFAKMGFSIDESVSGLTFTLSGGQVGAIAVNVITLAMSVAAAIMLLGTIARSQREAGIYTAPLIWIAIALAVFSLSTAEFATSLYAIPILGNSLAMKDVFLQSLDWTGVVLPVASNLLLCGILMGTTVLLYRREEVLFRE